MRVCSKCKLEKEDSEFFNHKDGKIRYVCKDCHNTSSQKSRTKRKLEDIELYKFKQNIADRKLINKNPHKRWAQTTINGHRRKGLLVLIHDKELTDIAKQTTHCKYCGSELNFEQYIEKEANNKPSLDRINNEHTMTIENTQIICVTCNLAKGKMTHKEFIEHIKSIANRW